LFTAKNFPLRIEPVLKGTSVAIASIHIERMGSLTDPIGQALAIMDGLAFDLRCCRREILSFPTART
jgi:hypothetical protein